MVSSTSAKDEAAAADPSTEPPSAQVPSALISNSFLIIFGLGIEFDSICRSKNPYKDPDDGRQRFLLELEFVQCLANPTYIHCEFFIFDLEWADGFVGIEIGYRKLWSLIWIVLIHYVIIE